MSANVHFMLLAAVLLFAQLQCMAKLKYSKICLFTYPSFYLNKEFSCTVFVA